MLPLMRNTRWMVAALCACAGATLLADEGMWRIDQLPRDVIAQKYGVRLTDADLDRLRYAPVRLQAGGSGGARTFAASHGMILANPYLALDSLRAATLAAQNNSRG